MTVPFFLSLLSVVLTPNVVFNARNSTILMDSLKKNLPVISHKCRLDGVSTQNKQVLIRYKCPGSRAFEITLYPKQQADTFRAGTFWIRLQGTKRFMKQGKIQVNHFLTTHGSEFGWTRPKMTKKQVTNIQDGCKKAMARLEQARKTLSKGDTRSGIQMIRKVVKSCKQTGMLLNALDLMRLFSLPDQNKFLQNIVELAVSRLKKDPKSFAANLDYALVLAHANRLHDAIQAFKRAMNRKPDNIRSCPTAMMIQAMQGTKNKDIAWKFALSVVNSGHPCKQALISALWMAHNRKDVAGIKQVLNRGLTVYPKDSEIRLQAAYALDTLEAFDDAFDLFLRLAIQDPARPRVLSMLGTVAVDANNRQALITRLKKMQKTAKNKVPINYVMGVFAYYKGDFDKAEKLIAPAMKAAPKETRPTIYIALIRFWRGDFETARRMLVNLEPKAFDDPDVYYCEAVIWADRDIHKATVAMETYVTMMNREKGRVEFGNKRARAARILKTLKSGKVPDELYEDLWHYRYRRYYGYAMFGGIGLIILLVAAWFVWKKQKRKSTGN